MEKKHKILSVEGKIPITVYKNYAFPLCILCADESNAKYLYNHFGNIYLMRDKSNYVWLDFLEPNNSFSSFLDYERIKLCDLKGIDIIDLIRNTIDENKYVTLFLDHFYIESASVYGKRHFFFESFIYGYDDEKELFYSFGFDSSEKFCQLTYSYSSVKKAFDSLINNPTIYGELPIWILWYTFSKIKKKYVNTETIDINTIINDIEEYSFSKNVPNKLRDEIIEGRGHEAVYGANCQKEIIVSLYAMLEDKFYLDYRHIHLLAEHKKMMIEKMFYIEQLTKIDFSIQINHYKEIIKKIEIVRMLYLKGLIANGKIFLYDHLHDKFIVKKIIRCLEDISCNEHEVLNEFIFKVNEIL